VLVESGHPQPLLHQLISLIISRDMSKVDRSIRAHKKHLKGNRQDVRAKKGEFEVEIDVFDKGLPINKMTDICQLCKGDHFDGELMHKNFSILGGGGDEDDGEADATKNVDMLDPEGIWASRYSIKSSNKRRSFVHFDCALYAPQISFNGIEWSNIRKEILRGSTLSCYHCNRKGSTILCSQPRCNYIVHLPCAIKEGFLPSRFVNTCGYYCRIHSKQNMDVETHLDKLVELDASLGRETIPVIMENGIDDLLFPTGFEYITSNVDSDAVIATPQNVCSDDFQCCDCVGLCNDVNQCACLRVEYQRNYSSKGKLIPGADRPLLECNMRCNCSVNRCTNRVVERGLQYPLQLFRRSYGVNKSSASDSNGASSATSAAPKKRLRQGPTDEKVRDGLG
jgi:Pre-SET motif/PHD-like zinc-binding domain